MGLVNRRVKLVERLGLEATKLSNRFGRQQSLVGNEGVLLTIKAK